MVEGISPISVDMRLAQLLGEEPAAATAMAPAPAAGPSAALTGNPFEDVLAKAIDSLEGVSRSETYANQMIEGYVKGQVDLQDVMIAQSKMSVMAQLAVTTVNAAVGSFKEITQMQI